LASARGAFIALIDADDVWNPRKIEKQIAVFSVVIGLGLSTAIPEISMSTDVITEQEWQKELRANAEHRRGGD